MLEAGRQVRELEGVRASGLPAEVRAPDQPLVLRALVDHWPMVAAAKDSDKAAMAYLRRFHAGATVNAVRVDARHSGRVFYNEDLSGFNFEAFRMPLDAVLDEIARLARQADPDTLYVGSTTLDKCLPGFRGENDFTIEGANPLVSIWLGNRTRVAAHFDVPDNMACCVAGRRRVTLFPPEQIANLYPGPLDFTPAGQTISMVDFHRPDPDRFPRFSRAMREAQVAELQPGDALIIPSTWWHHVEAEGPFNALVNYWWRRSPPYMDSPVNVLEYALLALRDLPPEQRAAWDAIFRFYVFDFDQSTIAHIPERRQGVLAPMDELGARRLRARLLKKINR